MKTLSDVFKAMGDENRLKILEILLTKGECCGCVLLSSLEISQPTLSHHMKILCESGLILHRRDGKTIHYRVNREVAEEMKNGFLQVLAQLDAMDALENKTKEEA